MSEAAALSRFQRVTASTTTVLSSPAFSRENAADYLTRSINTAVGLPPLSPHSQTPSPTTLALLANNPTLTPADCARAAAMNNALALLKSRGHSTVSAIDSLTSLIEKCLTPPTLPTSAHKRSHNVVPDSTSDTDEDSIDTYIPGGHLSRYTRTHPPLTHTATLKGPKRRKTGQESPGTEGKRWGRGGGKRGREREL